MRFTFRVRILIIAGPFLLMGTSVFSEIQQDSMLTNEVNPFIGTGFYGQSILSASVPFGMVRVGPDVESDGWLYASGYHYTAESIMGFSQLHPGGDIQLMPTTGLKIKTIPGTMSNPDAGYRSRFSHAQEISKPEYYQVRLNDYDITVGLTASKRVSFHKYIFPKADDAHVLLDLGHSNYKNYTKIAHVRIIAAKSEIEGYRETEEGSKVYFVIRFNKPFDSFGTWDNEEYHRETDESKIFPYKTDETGKKIGAFVNYRTGQDEEILVKVGISFVNIDGARNNLDTEISGWDFNKVRRDAANSWNKELSKIMVKGGTKKQRTTFYTALYHSILYRNISNDVDGKYFGMDGKIHQTAGWDFYPDFWAWDIFRSAQPLMTIIEKGRVRDIILSVLCKYNEMKWFPAQHYRNVFGQGMVGDHLVPIVVDAFMKGIYGYDSLVIYQAMKEKALFYPSHLDSTYGRSGLQYYLQLGYIPCDRITESVSKTLEFSFDDWCIALLAKKLGREDDYKLFSKRGAYYKNMYDAASGFMRPRNLDGSWLQLCKLGKPPGVSSTEYNKYYGCFDPFWIGVRPYRNYTESNAWQYLFFAPQDIPGLIKLMGGKQEFVNKLDQLFTMNAEETGPKYVGTVGTIGQDVHGNEPSHHVPYLYNYAGQPWKTQDIVRRIMDELYNDTPGGLPGNEDQGAMSSWYVFSAMGFYPVTPGSTVYSIGSPIFDEVIIYPDGKNGKSFIIKTKNNSKENKYIQSAVLNGEPLNTTELSHFDIMKGGALNISLGNQRNEYWGTDK